MKKNNLKNKSSEDKKNPFKLYLNEAGVYIKSHYHFLILFTVGFLVLSTLNFLKINTTQSVAAFAIDDFEIGQIADRTIIASKTLPPDESNPVGVEEGEKIIKKGFAISEEAYAKLEKMSSSPVYLDTRAFANSELYLFLISILWYLFFLFVPIGRKLELKEPLFQLILFFIVYGSIAFGGKVQVLSNTYALCCIMPTTLCVLLVSILYGNISACLFSIVLSLGVLDAASYQLIPFLYTLATALITSAIVRKIENRLNLVFASMILAIINALMLMFIMVIFNDTFGDVGKAFLGVAANGFLSGILCLGLLTPLEMLMNTASVFRLMDLSDLNNPLMRKMLLQASGTYSHSMMVAQLAESACREIGANSLLARVGAYYHDIGKIDQSEYFVENQHGINKHNEINPTLSTTVIKSHVKRGIEKAHQLHLPKSVVDIIAEHHGNSVIAYFYNEAKEKDPTLAPEDFAYAGNPPSSRESAVVMLADTVEAACRTLENPSVPRLEKFISALVAGKVEHKQLDYCDLTFRDLTKIKAAFVQILAGYYHSRIEYPDQVDPDKDKDEPKELKGVDDKPEPKTEKKSVEKK